MENTCPQKCHKIAVGIYVFRKVGSMMKEPSWKVSILPLRASRAGGRIQAALSSGAGQDYFTFETLSTLYKFDKQAMGL